MVTQTNWDNRHLEAPFIFRGGRTRCSGGVRLRLEQEKKIEAGNTWVSAHGAVGAKAYELWSMNIGLETRR